MQFFGVDFGFFNGHGFLFCIPSQSKGEDFLRGVPKFFGKFRATVGLKKTIPLGSFGLTKGPPTSPVAHYGAVPAGYLSTAMGNIEQPCCLEICEKKQGMGDSL